MMLEGSQEEQEAKADRNKKMLGNVWVRQSRLVVDNGRAAHSQADPKYLVDKDVMQDLCTLQ